MKEAFWGYLIIALGLFIIVVIIFVQNLTTTDEEDFYLGREVMEAAMIDAVDYGYYRTTGKIKIIEQKFVENFMRRFAESVSPNKNYKVEFYEIYELPPKATVRIRAQSGTLEIDSDSLSVDIDTLLHGILETKN